MNTAEIKLDLFRKIDNLKEPELKRVYKILYSLLNYSEKYTLTSAEKKAIGEAIRYSKKGKTISCEAVANEAKSKYSRLKFK